MSEDYGLAGEVVEGFMTLGNVARAMVLQGMKEYTRQTFGEQAVTLFGDEESIGGSSGGGSKRGVIKMKDYPEDNLEFAKLLASKCKILVYHAGI
jgi:hypothetical protein